jgi:hypothetical protein
VATSHANVQVLKSGVDKKSAWELCVIEKTAGNMFVIEKHAQELFKIEKSRQELFVTALRFTV